MPRSTRLVVRLIRRGCSNRNFYHLSLMRAHEHQHLHRSIEQLGIYDDLLNECSEKVTSLNINRLKYWMALGSDISKPAAKLLGLSGFLFLHPINYYNAWKNRKRLMAIQTNICDQMKGDSTGLEM